jgi:uncharacterized membrane protein
MPDAITIQNWVFNAAAIFLIIEGVLSTMDAMQANDKTTLSQARAWIRAILMVMLAIFIFWLTHSTKVKVNFGRSANRGNYYNNRY